MNLPDLISLILRIFILYFLTIISVEAMKKRLWAFVIIALGMYLSIFRLTLLRAMAMYIGVFGKVDVGFLNSIHSALMNGQFALITDIPFFIGSFAMFLYVIEYTYKLKNDK